jgi:hypothetical protein
MSLIYANMIIYRSPNCRDDWTPVLPQDVPDWVRDPDNLAQLVEGNACCDPALGEAGSDWYRAEVVNEHETERQQ